MINHKILLLADIFSSCWNNHPNLKSKYYCGVDFNLEIIFIIYQLKILHNYKLRLILKISTELLINNHLDMPLLRARLG